MTISTSTSRISYNGNAVTTVFSVPFRFFANADLVVELVDADDVSTSQVLDTDYTVTGADDEAGGSLTMAVAPGSTESLVIRRVISATQEVDYLSGDTFPAETHERALDRLTMLAQQNEEANSRALVFPTSEETGGVLPTVTERALKTLSFDALGNPVAVVPTTDSAADVRIDLASTASGDGAALVGADDGSSGTLWTTVAGFIARTISSAGASVVGFIQPGTGASVMTTQDVLRGKKAITHYGTAAQAVASELLGTLDIPLGEHTLTDLQLSGTSLRGRGAGSILKAGGATSVLKLGYVSSPSQWFKKKITDLVIDGNSKASDGITFADSSSTQISGRWVLDGLLVKSCAIGVSKPTGNIGNVVSNSELSGNDYGYFAVGQTSPIMHAGADSLRNVHFVSNALAAIYIDSPQTGTGGTAIRDCIIEGNPGFGIFIEEWKTAYTPLLIDNVWFESNATSTTVDVEAVTYTPVDLYLNNAVQVVLKNGVVPKTKLVNSHLSIADSLLSVDITTWDIDADSTVVVDRANISGGVHPVIVNSVSGVTRTLGNFVARFNCHPRAWLNWDAANILAEETFSDAATYGFVGTGAVNATQVTGDGRSHPNCAELVIPASYTLQWSVFSVTSGKWYVFLIDAKHVSGAIGELSFSVANSGTFASGLRPLLVSGKWRGIAVIGQAASSFDSRIYLQNGATGTNTIRLSAYRVMEFDSQSDAIEFFNSMA